MMGHGDDQDFAVEFPHHNVGWKSLEYQALGSPGASGTGHCRERNHVVREQGDCSIDRAGELRT